MNSVAAVRVCDAFASGRCPRIGGTLARLRVGSGGLGVDVLLSSCKCTCCDQRPPTRDGRACAVRLVPRDHARFEELHGALVLLSRSARGHKVCLELVADAGPGNDALYLLVNVQR